MNNHFGETIALFEVNFDMLYSQKAEGRASQDQLVGVRVWHTQRRHEFDSRQYQKKRKRAILPRRQ